MKKITLANKKVNKEIAERIESYLKKDITKKELLEIFSEYSWEYQIIKDELKSTTIAVFDNGGKYEEKIQYKLYGNKGNFIQEKTEFEIHLGWVTKTKNVTEEEYRKTIETLKNEKYRVLFEIAWSKKD